MITDADRLHALAELAPLLAAPDADFGHWELPPPRDGVQTLGWYEFGPAGQAFLAAVQAGDWVVVGFDWRSWMDADQGRAMRDDPDAVARADADQLAKLLTAIVRSDRFVEGSIQGAYESGLLLRIARRAQVLGQAPSTRTSAPGSPGHQRA